MSLLKAPIFKNSFFATQFLSKSKLLIYNGIVHFCLKDRCFKHTYLFVDQKYIELFTLEEKIHGFSFKALNICYGRTHHSQTLNTRGCIFNRCESVLCQTSFHFTMEGEKGKILLYFYMV